MLVFEERGKPKYREKTPRSRVENQQAQSTYDAGSGNRARSTLVEGERSHHCANPAPHMNFELCFKVCSTRNIKLGPVTNLNVIFHVVVSNYRLVTIWNLSYVGLN